MDHPTTAQRARLDRLAERDAARERRGEEMAHHRSELAFEHLIGHLPAAITDKVFAKAYEDGHASGWNQIAANYQEYAEVALDAYNAGKATTA